MKERNHHKNLETVLKELKTNVGLGLSEEEALLRLDEYGPNEFQEEKKKTKLSMFISQLRDPMIYILLAAALISAFLKELGDSVIILAIIILNGIIGMVQENKAELALEALKKISSPTALVRRKGLLKEIKAALLVPGDIVILEAGRVVPADLRLTLTSHLTIDESILTGESVPVNKDYTYIASEASTPADNLNMAYMSTPVSAGRGEGVVVETGMNTEVGKIAQILGETDGQTTPLQKRLGALGKTLGILALVICAIFFLIGILQGRDPITMLITSIALAVAVIPEGLPAIVTIVLALGVQRMVKINTIVRKLPAVETLGSVSIVCTDKTGTLTQNKMTVLESFGDENVLIKGMALCNDAVMKESVRIGDPTELALLDFAVAKGIDLEKLLAENPRIEEKSFDSNRKMMTTVHEGQDGQLVGYTKGAVDQLLLSCDYILIDGKARQLEEADKKGILDATYAMAKRSLRVLGLAVRHGDRRPIEEGLIFVGLCGMTDPPRPEAKNAIEVFKLAGVSTIMITGDHRDTALAIAAELGITDKEEECVTGDILASMTQEELNQRVMDIKVFARVSPKHKVMIVKAFQSHGHIVSMTGDGVNDGPSLKAADIGVAMGITGTDVAKGASDVILTDDNFATIESAIEEGRNIYSNIKKSVLFLLSSNFGEMLTMFTAVVLGLVAPLRAVHILWVNLITDSLPALALGVDPGNKDIMKEGPRDPEEGIFAGGGYYVTLYFGIVIAAVTLLAFIMAPEGDLERAQTYAFTVLAISQLFNAIGMRDLQKSVFLMNHVENKMMLVALFTGLLLQLAVTEISIFNSLFETVHLSFGEWVKLIILSSAPLLAHELLIIMYRIRNSIINNN